jgi:two-component sensor histidine kinase
LLGSMEAATRRRSLGTVEADLPLRLRDPTATLPRYDPRSNLLEARWQMVRLAIWIGFASILGVVVATLVPHHLNRYVDDRAVYLLAALGAAGNAGFGVLARRWRGRRAGEPLLLAWGVGLIGLVASLTYVGGGYASDYYLLYFLVIPFLAATQGPRTQVQLFALLALGYAIAVWAVPLHPSPGDLLLHLGVLVGAEALGWYLAAALRAEEMRRARLQAEGDLKHVLAVEANHRIENNLQLVADLLSFEAARPEASLRAVVDVTVSRVQAVAAVHRLLAANGAGQIQTRSVLEQVLVLLTERLGSESPVEARVEGSFPDLDPQSATWLAVAVNELATNAIVHGLGPNGGRLILRLEQGQRCRVVLEDDGAGCPGHVEGLGLGLVRRLVEQGLQGELCIRSEPSGTKAEILFPTKIKEVAQ